MKRITMNYCVSFKMETKTSLYTTDFTLVLSKHERELSPL